MKSNSPVLVLLSCLAWSPAFAQADSSASRICMAPASVKALAGSTTSTMEAVRESFTSFLTGPSLRVAPLAARLESQAREEARLAACPYLLFVSVEHKRHSGRNLLGKAASSAVQQGAYRAGSMVRSDAGSIAASAVAGAASAAVSDWAYTVKTKDELSIDFRLEAADGSVLVKQNSKRKAESDGEDLLTPQVEQAAGAIAEAVIRRSR